MFLENAQAAVKDSPPSKCSSRGQAGGLAPSPAQSRWGPDTSLRSGRHQGSGLRRPWPGRCAHRGAPCPWRRRGFCLPCPARGPPSGPGSCLCDHGRAPLCPPLPLQKRPPFRRGQQDRALKPKPGGGAASLRPRPPRRWSAPATGFSQGPRPALGAGWPRPSSAISVSSMKTLLPKAASCGSGWT